MKRFFLLLVFIFVTSLANAQFMNTDAGVQKQGLGISSSNSSSSYTSLRFTYSPVKLVSEYNGNNSSQSYNGIGLTYSYAAPCSENLPVFWDMEFGLRWLFNKTRESYNGYDITSVNNFLTLVGSANLLYRLALPGIGIVVEPLVGLDLPIHLLGKSQLKYNGKSETSDIFKNNDNYNVVNFDWHIGAKILFNDFFIQAAYEGPIVGLMNKDGYKVGFRMANLSIGFEF